MTLRDLGTTPPTLFSADSSSPPQHLSKLSSNTVATGAAFLTVTRTTLEVLSRLPTRTSSVAMAAMAVLPMAKKVACTGNTMATA